MGRGVYGRADAESPRQEIDMDFGWKKKAETLRMVLLSGAHQLAKELPAGISKTLSIFARVHKSGDGRGLQEELASVKVDEPERPLWEPVEIYGWKIQATFYLQNGQLWWLVHAARRNESAPSAKDIVFLDKVLAHLGADPKRDMIIGPSSSPTGEPPLPFGWWTWFNRSPLYEIQVNKDKKLKAMVRVVPLGAPETDGYQSLDALDKKEAGS
jgi:hypothetical protein